MHKKVEPTKLEARIIGQFPHCDQRILHAPGECEYCDRHPEWQELRIMWGIAFTGYQPDGKELPCPADHARGNTAHQAWPGNRPAKQNLDLQKITLRVDMGGLSYAINTVEYSTIGDVIDSAVSAFAARPKEREQWELRTLDGVYLPFTETVKQAGLKDKTKVFLTLRPGVGG